MSNASATSIASRAVSEGRVASRSNLAKMARWLPDHAANIKFVQEVEKYPCLYNWFIPEYVRKDLTEQAWSDIGKKFKLTGLFFFVGITTALLVKAMSFSNKVRYSFGGD